MARAVALAFLAIVFAFAHAQALNTTAHTISVSGYGNIQSLSDIAVVSFLFSGGGHWPTYLMLSQFRRFSGVCSYVLLPLQLQPNHTANGAIVYCTARSVISLRRALRARL